MNQNFQPKMIFYFTVSQVSSITSIIELSYLHLSNSSTSWLTGAFNELEPLRGTYRGPVGHGIA